MYNQAYKESEQRIKKIANKVETDNFQKREIKVITKPTKLKQHVLKLHTYKGLQFLEKLSPSCHPNKYKPKKFKTPFKCHSNKKFQRIYLRKDKPARANFNPVSMSGILGTNTPGVSRTYMLG